MDLNRGVILQLRFGTLLRISFYIGFMRNLLFLLLLDLVYLFIFRGMSVK